MFRRSADNPILETQGDTWESLAVYNATAWTDGEIVYLLYRAEGPSPFQPGRRTSYIGLATSRDGVSFSRRSEPVLQPTEAYEMPGGCEDPRLVRIGSMFYLTYNAYDGEIARIALATSHDLITWQKRGVLFPQLGWNKSAALVPQQIGGRYWLYFGDTEMRAAYSEDLEHWTVVQQPVLSPRAGLFDERLVEPGPPPVVTSKSLVLIHNAANRDLRYAITLCTFSRDDPLRVVERAVQPLLVPQAASEMVGQVPNVTFAEGLVYFQGRWLLYYGMADSRLGLAIGGRHAIPDMEL